MKQKIKDRNGKERILDERSLENLKLGPLFRDQGKNLNKNRTLQYLGKFKAWLLKR